MLVLVGEEGHCSHSLTAMVHIRTGPHPAPAHCPLGRNKEEKLDEEHCFDSFSRFPLGNEGNKLALRMGFSGCWERGREAGGWDTSKERHSASQSRYSLQCLWSSQVWDGKQL